MDTSHKEDEKTLVRPLPAEPPTDEAAAADEAARLLDAARTAFQQRDYETALQQVDQAIDAIELDDPLFISRLYGKYYVSKNTFVLKFFL